jgi:ABC-2 type transport system permease protein
VPFHGDLWQIILFQILLGILAVSLGIFISAFARNEFQMIQFIPLIIVPQVFICGLIFPVSQLPNYLQWIGKFLPLTYGVDGIRALMLRGEGLANIGKDIGILAAYTIVLLILAGMSLRRGNST